MITGKINASKIDKSGMHEGKNGLYFDITLLENKDGPDQWGNSGMIVQDLGKERRLAGERGPILGNWKHIGQQRQQTQQQATPQQSQQAQSAPWNDSDDIIF